MVRYCLNGEVVECFLTLIQISSHTEKALAKTLLNYLADVGINFMDCRRQSYDNASNMSGQYNGMQVHLKRINPLAIYIPCAAYFLNLAGVNSVDCCVEAVSFFGFIKQLYTFFSASMHRWSVLAKHQVQADGTLILKSLSDTRWSAQADATKTVSFSYA